MDTIPVEKINSRDGTPIAYYRSGAGSPLVLVSGAGAANPAAWPVSAALAEHFAVYAVDRRGHGASGDGPAYTIEHEFDDIAAVVDSLGEPANLLGYSYGGLCSLEASLRTGNIRKLILYEPLSLPLPGKPVYAAGFIDRLEELLEAGDREGVLVAFYREIAGMAHADIEQFRSSPAWQERLAAAHTLPRELRAEERYQFHPQQFKHLRLPILLLTGGESREFEKKGTEVLAAALPCSQVAVMAGQGHIAMYTAPERFLYEVLKFFSGPGA